MVTQALYVDNYIANANSQPMPGGGASTDTRDVSRINTDDPFGQVLLEMWDMHVKKGMDYGSEEDQYANIRGSEAWGIAGWLGSLLRQNDKMKRLQKYARARTLANESAEDSFLDNAVYAVIALVLWREENK